MVGFGTLGTVVGWILWDYWVGKEEANKAATQLLDDLSEDFSTASTSSKGSAGAANTKELRSEVVIPSANAMTRKQSMDVNSTSLPSTVSSTPTRDGPYPPYGEPVPSLSPRNQQRLSTLKSAVLIYCALLGLSPILKSLTKSTTSDSIWAMSTWLMCINVFFFDYGGEPVAK